MTKEKTPASEGVAKETKKVPAAKGKEVPVEGIPKEGKEIKEVPKLNDEGKADEEKLEESLSVIKEVRNELAVAYKEQKEASSNIEQLQSKIIKFEKSNEDSKKTIESLTSQLTAYKTRDEQAAQVAYNKRLEQLSKVFKELGQEKSIEQLSKLPKEVIAEFEIVTNLALSKRKEEEQLSTVTVPTQGMPQKVKQVPVAKKSEALAKKDFLTGICNELQGQQQKDGSDKKRTLIM